MRAVVIFAIAGACIILAALTYMVLAHRPAEAQISGMSAVFVADPNNDTRLSVRGWDRTELDKIVADFLQQYGLPRSTMAIGAQPDETLTITFPNDIEPKFLFFLINYIHYTNDFDLKRRSIGAVAHVVLTPAFGIPDSALAGKRAIIYVPANDTEYDLVYAQVADKAYQISFTDLVWRDMADAHLPAAIRGL